MAFDWKKKSLGTYSNIFYLQVKAENKQNKNKIHQLENEIQRLHEKIKSMEEIQGLADQRLQEADEEKEAILAQLENLEKRVRMGEGRSVHCLIAQKNKTTHVKTQMLNTASSFSLNFTACPRFRIFF